MTGVVRPAPRDGRSLRAQLLLLVVAAVVLPLALIGLWLTRATARAGEVLLRSRLEAALAGTSTQIGQRWVETRGALLDLSDAPEVRLALGDSGRAPRTIAAGAALHPGVHAVLVRDAAGTVRWRRVADSASASRLTVELPLWTRDGGRRVGTLEGALAGAALLTPGGGAAYGVTVFAVDSRTGAPLLPVGFDPALARADDFEWNGERWLAARRVLREPPIELVAVAPLADYAAPFRGAARRGVVALAAVAVLSVVATVALTRRTTRALERLAVTADAVAHGDFGRTVPQGGGAEVGRVARAFNVMSEGLRRTLDTLAQRESLAAVGEFAAGLAHEVRNPLTSMRIDLQRAIEKLPADAPVRTPVARALAQVERLDATVGGALRIARSGGVSLGSINLLVPLDSAVHAAEAEVARAGGTLSIDFPSAPVITVAGDAAALEQLFLNLLLNAAQALDRSGEVRVRVDPNASGGDVRIVVTDTGRGIPPDALERVFEPFYTTRAQGTGLGLAIARRIARAHRGDVAIESTLGAGTTVTVRLPRAV